MRKPEFNALTYCDPPRALAVYSKRAVMPQVEGALKVVVKVVVVNVLVVVVVSVVVLVVVVVLVEVVVVVGA